MSTWELDFNMVGKANYKKNIIALQLTQIILFSPTGPMRGIRGAQLPDREGLPGQVNHRGIVLSGDGKALP